MRDPHECLTVPRSAAPADIKKPFRWLAKKLHPDANKNNPRAAALFAELKGAYKHEILGNETKRRAFDQGDTFDRSGIDTEDNPTPEAVAIVISQFTFSVAGLIVAMVILAASPLIMRTLIPPNGIHANSADGDRILSRVSESEERAPVAQAEQQDRERPQKPTVPAVPMHSAENLGITDNSDNKMTRTAALTDQNPTHQPLVSQLDHEEIELLIGRGEKLLSEGDVGAARNLLQRAAKARDARAALALGATYDPIMLAILQAQGVAADPSLARDWYKKASEFGSREAQERLTLLAAALVEPKRRVMRAPVHVVAVSHEVVPHTAVPRVAPPPHDPNGHSATEGRVGAVPDPGTRAQLVRNDANPKLPTLFGIGN